MFLKMIVKSFHFNFFILAFFFRYTEEAHMKEGIKRAPKVQHMKLNPELLSQRTRVIPTVLFFFLIFAFFAYMMSYNFFKDLVSKPDKRGARLLRMWLCT